MSRRELLPLACIVLLAGAGATVYALQLSEFVIMPDELGYMKQAVSFSRGELPTPGDFWWNSWALLQPALLSPFYRAMSTTSAFDAAHVLGAFVMASATIPAYLIARRVTAQRGAALLAAALCVALPWLGMAGTIMTEVVAYPAFLWACLAMLNGIARPGWRGDALVALAVGVAFLARTQLLLLALAYVIALLLDVLVRPRGDADAGGAADAGGSADARGAADEGVGQRLAAALRAHAATIAVVVIGTGVVLATGSVRRVLGSYSDPTEGALFPEGTGIATRELAAYVVVAAGALPLAAAAAWAVLALWQSRRPDERGLAALVLGTVPLLAIIGGSFTVRFTAGINDRYLFYAAPLLLIATVVALARPPRRFTPALLGFGALTVWLIAAADLQQRGPSLISPSMAWHQWLWDRADSLGTTAPVLAAILAGVLVVGAAAASRLLRPAVALAVVGGVLLVSGLTRTAYTLDQVASTQSGVSQEYLSQRGWVDRALPPKARAVSVIAPLGDPQQTAATWWDTSFWNKAVDRVMTVGAGTSLSQTFVAPMSVEPETGRVPALDPYRFVLRAGSDTRFGLRGSRTVASYGGVVLLEAPRPYQADWSFSGTDPDAAVVGPGSEATLRVFPATDAPEVEVTAAFERTGDGQATMKMDGASGGAVGFVDDGRLELRLPARFGDKPYADFRVRVEGDDGDPGARLVSVTQEVL